MTRHRTPPPFGARELIALVASELPETDPPAYRNELKSIALTPGFDWVVRLQAMRMYEALTPRDGCKFCLGHKGGEPGNENVIKGVVVCDYCTALLMTMQVPLT